MIILFLWSLKNKSTYKVTYVLHTAVVKSFVRVFIKSFSEFSDTSAKVDKVLKNKSQLNFYAW